MRAATITAATLLVASGVSAASFFDNSGKLNKPSSKYHTTDTDVWLSSTWKRGEAQTTDNAGVSTGSQTGSESDTRLSVQSKALIRPDFGWPVQELKPPVAGRPIPTNSKTLEQDTHRVDHVVEEKDQKKDNGMSTTTKLSLGIGMTTGAAMLGGTLLCGFKVFGLCKSLGASKITSDLIPSLKLDATTPNAAQSGVELQALRQPTLQIPPSEQERKASILDKVKAKLVLDKTSSVPEPIFKPESKLGRREVVFVKDA